MWSAVDELKGNNRQLLFVIVPNATNMALISGFGLHGGAFSDDIDLHYFLPSLLFKIPIVREFLIWSGAVCAKGDKDINGQILRLLKRGKSVAYCPTGMRNYFDSSSSSSSLESGLDFAIETDLFQFAQEKNIYIVPVLVQHEQERYMISNNWRIQRLLFNYLHIPIPLLFIPRVFGEQPPPRMVINVGVPMNPAVQQDSDNFRLLCVQQLNGFKK